MNTQCKKILDLLSDGEEHASIDMSLESGENRIRKQMSDYWLKKEQPPLPDKLSAKAVQSYKDQLVRGVGELEKIELIAVPPYRNEPSKVLCVKLEDVISIIKEER